MVCEAEVNIPRFAAFQREDVPEPSGAVRFPLETHQIQQVLIRRLTGRPGNGAGGRSVCVRMCACVHVCVPVLFLYHSPSLKPPSFLPPPQFLPLCSFATGCVVAEPQLCAHVAHILPCTANRIHVLSRCNLPRATFKQSKGLPSGFLFWFGGRERAEESAQEGRMGESVWPFFPLSLSTFQTGCFISLLWHCPCVFPWFPTDLLPPFPPFPCRCSW